MERTNAWLGYSEEQLSELERINNLYKSCLDEGKTERECVKAAVRIAKEKGYKTGFVMWPIRTAVSGKQSTPGGATELMEILGKEESIARIKAAIEKLSE